MDRQECECGCVCAGADVCHATSWKASVSSNGCHSTGYGHVCMCTGVCVCVCLQLTVCIFEHDERSDGGRQKQAGPCNRSCRFCQRFVLPAVCDFNEELCVCLVVRWVWFSERPSKSVNHRPTMCMCPFTIAACVCLFLHLRAAIARACLFMLADCLCLRAHTSPRVGGCI